MAPEVTICSSSCLIALPLAIVPSILWLLFFMNHDKHKEKGVNIMSVFLWGVVIALPVVIVEASIQQYIYMPLASLALAGLAYSFIAVAFVEEFAKYLVVKFKAMPFSFFDEAQDAIVYMITAALGFAAIENLAYAINFAETAYDVLTIAIFRGVSATFLHAVASGTLGYFLALSLINLNERRKFLYTGIALATILHGVYNNFIMDIGQKISEAPGVVGGMFIVSIIATLLIISGIIILIALNRLADIKFTRQNNE